MECKYCCASNFKRHTGRFILTIWNVNFFKKSYNNSLEKVFYINYMECK
ncbi:hypothetical protein QQI_1418 [Clostridioides difficile Y401]|nr:hypothetical protein QQI_1418 [Clostridioides difficile Y401]